MTTPTTAELLKYADLQMAAEAFLANPDGTIRTDLKEALTDGNKHSSKFTETQAQNFLDHWKVVAQQADTPTGFSGTLFKCIKDDPLTGAKKDELVMSFRSTEFIDDAARDNQATNAMEIREAGFAFGQIRDMEAWYKDLKKSGLLPEGQKFDVTGYSLGGHLATAFNMMHGALATADYQAPIGKVVTFNGAGVGGLLQGIDLNQVIFQFTSLAANEDGQAFHFKDSQLSALYQRARATIKAGGSISSADLATLETLRNPPIEGGVTLDAVAAFQAHMV